MTEQERRDIGTRRKLACPLTHAWMDYVPGGGAMGAQFKCEKCRLIVRIPWKVLERVTR